MALPEIRVMSVEYRASAPTMTALSAPTFPSPSYASSPSVAAKEVAFIGRSNVGKSSLLNLLVDKRDLMRVSKTPGRTQAVNLFDVELGRVGRQGTVSEKRHLTVVDLPGYGYAKIPKSEQARISKLLAGYLGEREALVGVCQLLDGRHGVTASDAEVCDGLLNREGVDVVWIATKMDKLASTHRSAVISSIAKKLQRRREDVIVTSAHARLGRKELLVWIWDRAAP